MRQLRNFEIFLFSAWLGLGLFFPFSVFENIFSLERVTRRANLGLD
jgi:hypothetical protein